jgi:hypothetical protein
MKASDIFKNAEDEEIDWNACPAWDGEEKSLPAGGQIRAGTAKISTLLKEYIKAPDGAVIGAVVNEDVYNQLVETFGERAIVLTDPSNGNLLTRREWKEQFGTDGLKLWLVMDVLRGSGVTTHTPTGRKHKEASDNEVSN